jgi:hypothetical protein
MKLAERMRASEDARRGPGNGAQWTTRWLVKVVNSPRQFTGERVTSPG